MSSGLRRPLADTRSLAAELAAADIVTELPLAESYEKMTAGELPRHMNMDIVDTPPQAPPGYDELAHVER